MNLSCWYEYDAEPGDVCWWTPQDFSTYEGKRPKKCRSCGEKVETGDTIAAFDRYKIPEHEVEIAIYGEDGEIPRATWFMCERCAGLYFSLYELGFNCIDIRDDMRDLVKDYARDYGPNPVVIVPRLPVPQSG